MAFAYLTFTALEGVGVCTAHLSICPQELPHLLLLRAWPTIKPLSRPLEPLSTGLVFITVWSRSDSATLLHRQTAQQAAANALGDPGLTNWLVKSYGHASNRNSWADFSFSRPKLEQDPWSGPLELSSGSRLSTRKWDLMMPYKRLAVCVSVKAFFHAGSRSSHHKIPR